MIGLPSGTKVWLAAGATDLRRGCDGLAALVQTKLETDPFAGHLFVFRGRRGDLLKILWRDGQGMCLFSKRLERGRFVWPSATEGRVALTPAQLSMLLDAKHQAIGALEQRIADLQLQIAVLRRARFTRRSEKLDEQLSQLELMLEELQRGPAGSFRSPRHCYRGCLSL